ncbi:MAG: glycosyltransferase family 9 protein, partial [Chloroflexi bacterium]|nr:glycosyltransferase family 9 protein [Chloroflexota bacterium]
MLTLLCTLLYPLFWPARRRKWREPGSIVILKPCCFGDVVMATALLGAVRRAYPHARVDWAVGDWSRPAVQHHPELNGLLDASGVGQGGVDLARAFWLVRQLRQGGYEAAFIPDRSPLLAVLAWLAGIPQRAGLNSRGRGFAHTRPAPVRGVKLEADLYLDCARAAGLEVEGIGLRVRPGPEGRKAAAVGLKKLGLEERPFAAIHPGGGNNPGMQLEIKRWPPEYFARLARRLVERGRLAVVAVGGPQDGALTAAVKGLVDLPVHDWGGVQWDEIGALAERAALYVGNDTGATHMATAVGCKTVMVMGPSDPARYAPFAPPEQACAAWKPWRAPAQGVRGGAAGFDWQRDGVTVDEVWEACRALLGERAWPQYRLDKA